MRTLFFTFLVFFALAAAACSDSPAAATLPTRVTPVVEPTSQPTEAPPLAVVATAADTVLTATAKPDPTPSPPATETPTPTPLPPQIITPLDDGRIEYRYPGEMFALALPASWSVADLAGFQGGEFAAETAAGGDLQDLFTSGLFRDLIDSGIRFYALNSSAQSLDSANPASINIVSIPVAGRTLADLVADNLTQIADNFELVDEVVRSEVQIDGRPAVQLSYGTTITNPFGEAFQLKTWQYLVEGEGRFLILTGTVVEELSPLIGPEIEAAASSFKITSP